MDIGVFVSITDDVQAEFRKVRDLGMKACQLNCWDEALFTDRVADEVLQASAECGVRIAAFWCGWDGPKVWDLYDGPHTLGLVPTVYRYARMKTLMKGSDFARLLGVPYIITHVGFIPENPNDPLYPGLVGALRHVVEHCGANQQDFLFETGQETPVTLLRTMEDIGLPNLGVNLDPANLVLYGKGNPVDALDVFGRYVKGVHGKDGLYPTNGRSLGREVPVGEGKVDYNQLLTGLRKHGFDGLIAIEREISGEKQIQDIRKAKQYLERIIADWSG